MTLVKVSYHQPIVYHVCVIWRQLGNAQEEQDLNINRVLISQAVTFTILISIGS